MALSGLGASSSPIAIRPDLERKRMTEASETRQFEAHHQSEPIGPGNSLTAICTLFEGDYHFGLAAFVNSLVASGYSGTIWAGYRGPLPPWLNQLTRVCDGNDYVVVNSVRLAFREIKSDIHLANYKPQFMMRLLAEELRGCDYLWYFDPDIFIRCSWSHFERWQRYGIALCEEIVNYHLAERDPLRCQWMELGSAIGLGEPRALNRYFNSGMIGIGYPHIGLLHIWQRVLEQVASTSADLKSFMPGKREMPFHSTDQDALNMALMYISHPLTTMGPEAMGFIPSGFTMYHATGIKPWKRSLLLRALRGTPPPSAAKFFFSQAQSPIHAYSAPHFCAKQLECELAALIGRFYSRK